MGAKLIQWLGIGVGQSHWIELIDWMNQQRDNVETESRPLNLNCLRELKTWSVCCTFRPDLLLPSSLQCGGFQKQLVDAVSSGLFPHG